MERSWLAIASPARRISIGNVIAHLFTAFLASYDRPTYWAVVMAILALRAYLPEPQWRFRRRDSGFDCRIQDERRHPASPRSMALTPRRVLFRERRLASRIRQRPSTFTASGDTSTEATSILIGPIDGVTGTCEAQGCFTVDHIEQPKMFNYNSM
jgi:hypothetical protein